jgi:hypothetical protein
MGIDDLHFSLNSQLLFRYVWGIVRFHGFKIVGSYLGKPPASNIQRFGKKSLVLD